MIAAFLLALATGNTWYVDASATPPGNGSLSAPYTSIQYALDQPSTTHGDVLSVAAGLYVENVTFTKRVRVEGQAGPLATVLRGAAPGTVVTSLVGEYFPPSGYEAATVAELTIDGGGDPSGTGARVHLDFSVLRLRRCIVTGFTAGLGVHQDRTNFVDMYQCTVSSNQSGVRSDTFINNGSISLYGCIVHGNAVDAVNPFVSSGYNPHRSCVPAAIVPFGPGNFPGPPGFWDGAAGDFHLLPLSPCIDAAAGIGLPLDPDGSPPDVGALAYDPLHAPFPASYCTPKTNSQGCAVLVASSGSASVSGPDNFFLTATSALNNKPGLFLWSRGPQATPFAGATLCLAGPIVRGTPLSSGGSPIGSDCTGVYQWHFSQAYMASKAIGAGAILYAQAWGRDSGFAPPNNAQLSDARVFPVGP